MWFELPTCINITALLSGVTGFTTSNSSNSSNSSNRSNSSNSSPTIQYKVPNIGLLLFASTSSCTTSTSCTTSSNLTTVLNRDQEGSQGQSSLGPQLDYAGSAFCQCSDFLFSSYDGMAWPVNITVPSPSLPVQCSGNFCPRSGFCQLFSLALARPKFA